MKRTVTSVLLFLATTAAVSAQTSRMLSWNDPDQKAYEPMPVICIHGLNSDSSNSWVATVGSLSNCFSTTYFWKGASQVSLQRIGQPGAAYVETFDYGVYGDPGIVPTRGHEQTFDSIKMNAYDGVYNGWGQTLKQRIGLVRAAYASPFGDTNGPPVILLCHSMGGVVAHYYLTKSKENGGNEAVLRMITLGSPHYGSYRPNDACDATRGWLRRRVMRQVFDKPIKAGVSVSDIGEFFLGADYDNIWHYANPPLDHPEKTGFRELCVLNADNVNQVIAPYLAQRPVPSNGEYIFNSFEWFNGGRCYTELVDLDRYDREGWIQDKGDLVVPVWSQEGRPKKGRESDIMNGTSNSGKPIRPVIFGKTIDPVVFAAWDCFHSSETSNMPPILKSLCGVTYINTNSHGENFNKYLPLQDNFLSQIVCHSDEPGIGQMILLCQGAQTNPLVVPALNTWTNYGPPYYYGTPYPQNTLTGKTDLVGHQIIGDTSASIRLFGTIGAKNRAQIPIANSSDGVNTYYWPQEGNEYMPASLQLWFYSDIQPNLQMSPSQFLPGLVTNCLTLLDTNGAPLYQYGLFDQTNLNIQLISTNHYVFAQGTNLAGLYTPIVERGFDVPVDSATVVNLLCGINEREAAAGAEQTQWKTWITEWIDLSPTNTTITLNFFPKYDPTTWGFWLEDAFTETLYEDWTAYDTGSKTFTIPTPDAPRCLKVTYEAYLGGLNSYTNTYEGGTNFCVVPPLTNASALAGIPATPEFVQQMKDALYNIVPAFVDHTKAPAGNFNTWFEANTNATGFPMLATTNLVGVATNCFDSTTNLLSAADFEQVHTVLTNLQWTAVDAWHAEMQVQVISDSLIEFWGNYGTAVTTAQLAFASGQYYNWPLPIVYSNLLWTAGAVAQVGGEDPCFQLAAYNSRQRSLVTNVWGGAQFTASIYAFPGSPGDEGWNVSIFDANGQLSGQVPQLLANQTMLGSNGWAATASWWGAADPIANFPPNFPASAPTADTEQGFWASIEAVLKWDFKYK